jgi:3-dehydroquinate synthase
MATTVHVKLGERSYPIAIGRRLPGLASMENTQGLRALIVSDSNVDALHGTVCQQRLEARGIECRRVVVPAGESTKSLHWVEFLYSKAAEAGLDRASLVVALGGGMVGDLAGFVAATYLRGVRFAQMPTTLLAMVDSSVGGKTGVNLSQGKNLVGAFYQPVGVDADLDWLQTLPQREYVSGLAEVVKYGVIWDATLFGFLEKHPNELLERDPDFLERVVARCCEIKAEVVSIDEREIGPRAILNFGHTLGHALEKVDGYGAWLHGEALAIGMCYAAQLSVAVEGFPADEADRLRHLLRKLQLPVGRRDNPLPEWAALRQAMSLDKKTLQNRPRFVLAKKLGSVLTGCEVDDETLTEIWHVCCQ